MCVCIHIQKEIYYKEMTYTIIVAEKSYMCCFQAGDPVELMVQFRFKSQQAWDPRRVDVSVPVQVQRQEKTSVTSLQSGRGNALFLEGRAAFLFFSGLQVSGCHPPTLGRATCFTHFTYSDVNLIQKPFTDTPRIMFDYISGQPVAQSS